MDIIIQKPSEKEVQKMKACPIWSCEPSTFDWFYSSKETCLILEGEVCVLAGGKSVSFGAGDYVVFPKGLSCVWEVKKAVKKHYLFE